MPKIMTPLEVAYTEALNVEGMARKIELQLGNLSPSASLAEFMRARDNLQSLLTHAKTALTNLNEVIHTKKMEKGVSFKAHR